MPVLDVNRVNVDLHIFKPLGERITIFPMGHRAPPVQQTRRREDQCTRTHRTHPPCRRGKTFELIKERIILHHTVGPVPPNDDQRINGVVHYVKHGLGWNGNNRVRADHAACLGHDCAGISIDGVRRHRVAKHLQRTGQIKQNNVVIDDKNNPFGRRFRFGRKRGHIVIRATPNSASLGADQEEVFKCSP